ncbi:alcohol dehydrogenase catalytic domain-containing protein [Nonomuraea sp. NPDC050404]|uniref:zinc-binding dehydrogenase n=1 Tax=Nonomuraea sp. NPDC050404 TaxID=3155783 RepID=UPI0033E9EC9A
MRAAVRSETGGIRIAEVPDARVHAPTDAVVRVVLAAVCGTDLWAYHGEDEIPPGPRAGHEFLGVVEETGRDVRRVRPGVLVLAPFMWCDGVCPACLDGLTTSCQDGGMWGGDHDGGQGEAVRVPFADATLLELPLEADDERLPALLTLADVMATGLHAVNGTGTGPASDVTVIGDGAVGLCAVLAARRAGAQRIILLSRHDDRARVGERFGATEVVAERGEQARARVLDMTGGRGTQAVLECVGTQDSVDTALGLARDGGAIALVGAPHAALPGTEQIFMRNLTVTGGLTPARALIPVLLEEVMSGRLNPSPVFDLVVDLDGVPAAYRAMAGRSAIKALVRI